MKKVIFSKVLALMLLLGLNTPETAQAKGRVDVDVQWGMLWGCAAPGMCRVRVTVVWEKLVYFDNPDDKTLRVHVDKSTIPQDKMFMFAEQQFTLSDDFKFSSELLKGLGLPEGSYLPKGTYGLTEANGAFDIKIPIVK